MTADQLSVAMAAYRRAVEVAGSQSAFERVTGIKQQTVSYGLKNSVPVAPESVLIVERETGVSRHDLRPDIYPQELVASTASSSGEPFRLEAAR